MRITTENVSSYRKRIRVIANTISKLGIQAMPHRGEKGTNIEHILLPDPRYVIAGLRM